MPTRLYQYDRHIEIMNPGGLYGQARPENFPHVNDYRNNVVAEIMRCFNHVNMFNHGITEVQDAMRENDNSPAEFNVNHLTVFSVVLKDEAKTYNESIDDVNLNIACTQLAPNLSHYDKLLLDSILNDVLSIAEIKLKPLLKPKYGDKSNTLIKDKLIHPMMQLGLIAQTHPESPRHPQQKYYLTELGKALRKYLTEKL